MRRSGPSRNSVCFRHTLLELGELGFHFEEMRFWAWPWEFGNSGI